MQRREMLTLTGAGLAGLSLFPSQAHSYPSSHNAQKATDSSFSFCLNTSTINKHRGGGFLEGFEIASQAGYDGIEIWIGGLANYVNDGNSLKELKQRIDDWGLTVENAIGFAKWIVDDNDVRTQAMEQAWQEMDWLAALGCKRIAAPPAGATNYPGLDLDKAAERYRALLELGTTMGVMPQLEVWGFAKNLHKLSQVLYVAAGSGHPEARILPDVYHLFKGGSDFDGLQLISGSAIEIFHMNDYPAEPVREEMNDGHRVYPGDGIAPIKQVLTYLQQAGGPKVLSLELFNRDYWKEDPLTVAKTGLAKMKAQVALLEK